eukprot:TRINITY_DN182_c0_g1_i2.p1 TRINITY_DN182_c0_g1~~TRINITY_DN182_c0_g1_i2.p1  ORF type:complete len:855 (-),score=175.09 TRINITY_DN182_c0_g1_i2:95-2659(-)
MPSLLSLLAVLRGLPAIAVLLCFAVLATGCPDTEEACVQFRAFQLKYGRTYHTAEEEAHRYSVFVQNLAQAARLSAANPLATFGVTLFMDLTEDEFRASHMSYDPSLQDLNEIPVVDTGRATRVTLPTTYTATTTTPVKDQGQCGSCWAFAAAQVVESAWMLAGHPMTILSPAQITGCSTNPPNSGCNGGNVGVALSYVKGSSGLMLEATDPYPSTTYYSGVTPSCMPITGSVATISNYYKYTFDESVGSGADVVLYGGSTLAVALYANTLQTYTGGVLSCPSGYQPNHAVTLVGWGVSSGTNYWLIKNSWGSRWGENGYFRLQRGVGACSITQQGAYGAVSPSATACSTTSPCPSGQTCVSGACVTAGCTPLSTSVACGNNVCGTASDGCGNTLTCGVCPTTQTCVSGACVASTPACTPISASVACGTSVCGTASDGCGNTLTCGICPATQSCSAGACVAATGWTNFRSGANSFSMSDSGVVYNGNSASALQGYAWNSSATMISPSWNSIQCNIAASSGVVALGFRLGQASGATDGIYWKVNTATGAVSLVAVFHGKLNTYNAGSITTWSSTASNNFTVTWFIYGRSIYSLAFVNTNPVYSSWIGYSTSHFPSTGLAFVEASGSSSITFQSPTILTRTSLTLTLSKNSPCISPQEWLMYVADILNVPQRCISNVIVDKPCGLNGTGSAVSFSLHDCDEVAVLGYVSGGSVSSFSYSTSLADNLQSVIAQDPALIGAYVVESIGIAGATGAAGAAAATGGAGLSAGAIAGIAVGSAVGGLIAGAVVVAAVVGVTVGVYKAKKSDSESGSSDSQSPSVNVESGSKSDTLTPTVNVMNLEGHVSKGRHTSITARVI